MSFSFDDDQTKLPEQEIQTLKIQKYNFESLVEHGCDRQEAVFQISHKLKMLIACKKLHCIIILIYKQKHKHDFYVFRCFLKLFIVIWS